jgi:hypothetical protein
VRYLHTASLSPKGVLGSPAVLIGVAAIILLQLLFTYAPFMQSLFQTRSIGLADGAAILVVGVALTVLLELEKLVRRRLGLTGPVQPLAPEQEPARS